MRERARKLRNGERVRERKKERSGGLKGESWVGVREESGGAEAEVHEDTIGDGGVKWRRG